MDQGHPLRRAAGFVGTFAIGARSVIVVGLLGLVLQACAGGSFGQMPGGMGGGMGAGMNNGRSGTTGSAPSPLPAATEIVVVATEFGFDPSEIQLQAGEAYNITLDNRGAAFHDLTVEGMGFVLAADAGTRSTGGLLVEEPGRYSFICAVPGHAQAGMTGTLIVT